jgi:hypothetical protein
MSPGDPYVLTQGFDDFDRLAEVVREWSLDFVQLDCGPIEANLFQVGQPGRFSLGHYQFDRLLAQRGAPPTAWTIGIAADPTADVVWRG